MKRLWFAATAAAALGTGVTGNDEAPKEKVLFEERFIDKLGGGWSWIREDPKAWCIYNDALVLRTSPGYLHGGYNNAKRPTSYSPEIENPLAIEVHVEGDPKVQFEHPGVVWYVDDDNYVSLFQEVLGGKVVLQMVTEKNGTPRTAVARHDAKGVWIRLLISAGMITSQYRSSEKEAWRDVGQARFRSRDLPGSASWLGEPPKGGRRPCPIRSFGFSISSSVRYGDNT